MKFIHTRRAGRYYRVCDPGWLDPSDTSFSKEHGARWNVEGRFGALYLCRDLRVAAANARQNFAGEIHSLYDMNPEFQPDVVECSLGQAPGPRFVDAVTDEGLSAAGLPATYPLLKNGAVIPHARCQSVGLAAYAAADDGIACRSAAEATKGFWVGEELALFDRSAGLAARGRRRKFAEWYAKAN